jgi:hypothetical protein
MKGFALLAALVALESAFLFSVSSAPARAEAAAALVRHAPAAPALAPHLVERAPPSVRGRS